MKAWLAVPIVPVFLFGATILFQYGYNDFFGIPYGYISATSVDYTLFAYSIFNLVLGVLTSLNWLLKVGLVIVFLVFVVLCLHRIWRKVILAIIVVSLIWLLLSMVNFGRFIASHQADFLTFSENCNYFPKGERYIIPAGS
jgi:hypothetical protein